jgi:HK97 family phage major capsid protein
MDEQKKVLDQLALKKARPPLGRGGGNGIESNEHKAAFEQYIRRGDEAGLRELEAKAGAAGGLASPRPAAGCGA